MSAQDSRVIGEIKVLLTKGTDGRGIEKIEKTSTSGIYDTYTITYDDGSKTTYTITNGNGIESVEKTGTSGLVDTYTITFDNGMIETFDVTNGDYISNIAKTSTSGAVDTYTITMASGTTYTFTVVNGDGSLATDIIFDDTSAELGATTVQGAIDKIAKPTFSEASSRANIASGEKLSTIFGKIKKFFTDLKTVAFTGAYSDLTGKPNLATVATSGSYNDLTNQPSVQRVLWTNSNPETSFPAQDIYSLSLTGYDYVKVICRDSSYSGQDRSYESCLIPIRNNGSGRTEYSTQALTSDSSHDFVVRQEHYSRLFTLHTQGTLYYLSVTACSAETVYWKSNGGTPNSLSGNEYSNNTGLIPLKVIGCKYN